MQTRPLFFTDVSRIKHYTWREKNDDQSEAADETDADELLDDLPLCDLKKVLTDSTLEEYVRIDKDVCHREALSEQEIIEDILADKSKEMKVTWTTSLLTRL